MDVDQDGIRACARLRCLWAGDARWRPLIGPGALLQSAPEPASPHISRFTPPPPRRPAPRVGRFSLLHCTPANRFSLVVCSLVYSLARVVCCWCCPRTRCCHGPSYVRPNLHHHGLAAKPTAACLQFSPRAHFAQSHTSSHGRSTSLAHSHSLSP